jgi:amino acid transporter
MEAAACYIGECREPVRDAKIALTAEGLFGLFVYTALPIMVLAVLGQPAIAKLGIDAAVVFNGYIDAIFGTSTFWNWFVNLTIIAALLLSVLNALMGASRGLYQNAHDGILPKAFGWVNKHGAPSFAMLFSLVFSVGILCIGQILQIYIFSNMGYLFALALSLIGYGIFRSTRDGLERELRMPAWMGPVGLILGIAFLFLWAVGGWYATQYAVGAGYDWHGLPSLFLIGLILLLLYFPLNWWRRMEDRAANSDFGETPSTEGAAG